MKKAIALLLVLAMSAVLFAACGQKADTPAADPAKAILGQWEYEDGDYIYTFNEDGTGSYGVADLPTASMEFTYELKDGGKISILYTGNTEPFETEYVIEGNKLNIKDSFGSDTIYVKK